MRKSVTWINLKKTGFYMCLFHNCKKKKVVSSTNGVKDFCIVSFLNILFYSLLFEFHPILEKKKRKFFKLFSLYDMVIWKLKKIPWCNSNSLSWYDFICKSVNYTLTFAELVALSPAITLVQKSLTPFFCPKLVLVSSLTSVKTNRII